MTFDSKLIRAKITFVIEKNPLKILKAFVLEKQGLRLVFQAFHRTLVVQALMLKKQAFQI